MHLFTIITDTDKYYCVTIKANICSKAKTELYILARNLLNKGRLTNILYLYLFPYTFIHLLSEEFSTSL